LIVTVLVVIWAARLSIHIYLRNRNKTEDYRYKAWRDAWGKWFFIRSYLQVFILQGFLLMCVAAPVVAIGIYPGKALGILEYIGLAVWVTGFSFEVIGDAQLAKFLKNPENKGKLMQSGLWAYTRHPNYFGEATMWWGIWIIALGTPYGLISIIGPLLITFLLLKVSGVPMLEAKMSAHPDFPEYKRRVSVFVPWFPKKINGK
jgi:steroid 5-alpha reductase family enzyme